MTAAARRNRSAAALITLSLSLVALEGCSQSTSSAPSVSTVTPRSGSILGGTAVTITGRNFTSCGGTPAVAFGADPSYDGPIQSPKVTVMSDNKLRAKSPASYPGRVQVQVGTRCGWSHPDDAIAGFDVNDQGTTECTHGSCHVTVRSRSLGPITHVASGFLNGYTGSVPTNAQPLMSALRPHSWRYSVAPLALRRVFTPSDPLTIGLLESSWLTCTSCGDVNRPWLEPQTFAAYYMQSVRNAIAGGTAPQYWDVWNEPDGAGTVGQWLSTFATAYHAIKAADPAAKIVAPDTARFSITRAPSYAANGTLLDLHTFLDFAASRHLEFAALAYHDFGAPSGGLDDDPHELATHVWLARREIAAHPSLRGMRLFVDEYGPYEAASEPGWLVGMISALEASQPDQASLACDGDQACFSTINGLLGLDGTPQMPYWVYADYATMKGVRLAALSPASNISVLASRGPDGSIVALIGRHDACGPPPLPHLHASAPPDGCPSFSAPTHTPVSLSIQLPEPAGSGSAAVSAQRLANSARSPVGQNPVPTPPVSLPADASFARHQLTVTVAGVGDGDAVRLIVMRASTARHH